MIKILNTLKPVESSFMKTQDKNKNSPKNFSSETKPKENYLQFHTNFESSLDDLYCEFTQSDKNPQRKYSEQLSNNENSPLTSEGSSVYSRFSRSFSTRKGFQRSNKYGKNAHPQNIQARGSPINFGLDLKLDPEIEMLFNSPKTLKSVTHTDFADIPIIDLDNYSVQKSQDVWNKKYIEKTNKVEEKSFNATGDSCNFVGSNNYISSDNPITGESEKEKPNEKTNSSFRRLMDAVPKSWIFPLKSGTEKSNFLKTLEKSTNFQKKEEKRLFESHDEKNKSKFTPCNFQINEVYRSKSTLSSSENISLTELVKQEDFKDGMAYTKKNRSFGYGLKESAKIFDRTKTKIPESDLATNCYRLRGKTKQKDDINQSSTKKKIVDPFRTASAAFKNTISNKINNNAQDAKPSQPSNDSRFFPHKKLHFPKIKRTFLKKSLNRAPICENPPQLPDQLPFRDEVQTPKFNPNTPLTENSPCRNISRRQICRDFFRKSLHLKTLERPTERLKKFIPRLPVTSPFLEMQRPKKFTLFKESQEMELLSSVKRLKIDGDEPQGRAVTTYTPNPTNKIYPVLTNRRKQTTRACTNCVKAKSGCDMNRPCRRCTRLYKKKCVDREVKMEKKRRRSTIKPSIISMTRRNLMRTAQEDSVFITDFCAV